MVDVAEEFDRLGAVHFVAERLTTFNAATGEGRVRWTRYARRPSLSFNRIDTPLTRAESTEFPSTEYDRDPELPLGITLISDRAVRVRCSARDLPLSDGASPMLAGPVRPGGQWDVEEDDEQIVYSSPHAKVRVSKNPFKITLYDGSGLELTATRAMGEPASFSAPPALSFVRREKDLTRCFAAATSLAHGERLYGCGEPFTRLDKRGQRVVAYTRDAMGAQSRRMYKPIPFYMSSRGYGVFVHTSTPITFDFGREFDATIVAYTGDEQLDLFLFVGSPKQILREYTALTGRAPRPSLWSFGLWMSRIRYKSEQEVRDVAAKLREHRIPCDVIHLDTGWFETDWQCDFRFAPSRFPDPEGMINDLKQDAFRVSLWQLPYFKPKNPLYRELHAKGYFVENRSGAAAAEDGVLDFTNPEAVDWYERQLQRLLEMSVGAIKVDFGEDAPLHGFYANGRTGWHERNLFPLRYNRVVSDLTKRVTGECIIWARSAWAGSQRYPLHWGGDAENTDSAMAPSLSAGLSLGLCGFTFWSHDAGGFVGSPERERYARWLAMAALGSHARCHGAPPREPWAYDEEFVDLFRRIVEMRYRLLPYLVSQGAISSEHGAPMIRPLFLEHPHDPTSWTVEDEYLLGADVLVAPLFAETTAREAYLPPGCWVDYQTGQRLEGGGWRRLEAAELPVIVLVREGTLLPQADLAQHTGEVNWKRIDLVQYGELTDPASTRVVLPGGVDVTVTAAAGADGQARPTTPTDVGGV